jgi:glycine/D-amino acid oxidase-like deaminating enzyme
LIIGAGVHGLSTAYHLSKYLKAKGMGDGRDVLVVEKSSIAAGASGVACGNVRCNYFQEPMTRLMMHCMDIWESDPDTYAYNSVGYLTASFAPMADGLAAIHERHKRLGYPSDLICGEREVKKYMQGIFHDWQAEKLEAVLHEHRGGHAWSKQAIHGLAIKAETQDTRLIVGPTVTGFQFDTFFTFSPIALICPLPQLDGPPAKAYPPLRRHAIIAVPTLTAGAISTPAIRTIIIAVKTNGSHHSITGSSRYRCSST